MKKGPLAPFLFDDPQKRSAVGALVNRLALHFFPAVLAFIHFFSPLRHLLRGV